MSLIVNEPTTAIAQFLIDAGLANTEAKGTDAERLSALISALGDLFSTKTPTISSDLEENLRRIARDAHLSSILRERALYRLFLVTSTYKPMNGVQVPMWYGMEDQEGKPISTQEQFIALFTKMSGISRANTFRRIKLYHRLSQFGITGDEAWLNVLTMPYTMQKLLQMSAQWDKYTFKSVDPNLAIGIAKVVMPDQVPVLEEAFENDAGILSAYSPVVRKMVTEIETYSDAKEALEHIEKDIIGKPTITYRWLVDEEVIEATVTTPIVSDGELLREEQTSVVLYIDSVSPPPSLMRDLFSRLPIWNKHELPDP